MGIDALFLNKWSFHQKLSFELLISAQSSKTIKWNKSNIVDTFSLSCNQFKNRSIASLSNKEKLLMVEDVLKYPTMTNRISKLSKFIGLKSTKFLKKLMCIYPMLLVLNHKEISLHFIQQWNRWKCCVAKNIFVQQVSNDDLQKISLKDVLLQISQNEKGIRSLSPIYKLWLCSYILSKGGKSFICQFENHLQSVQELQEFDTSQIHLTNASLYNVYYNFCAHMCLCGQFPLSLQAKKSLNFWWNEC